MYKVEYGIEISKVKRPVRVPVNNFDYPFETMEMDGTFFIELAPGHFEIQSGQKKTFAQKQATRVSHQKRRYARNVKPGFDVVTRSRNIEEHGECGIRVWRVA